MWNYVGRRRGTTPGKYWGVFKNPNDIKTKISSHQSQRSFHAAQRKQSTRQPMEKNKHRIWTVPRILPQPTEEEFIRKIISIFCIARQTWLNHSFSVHRNIRRNRSRRRQIFIPKKNCNFGSEKHLRNYWCLSEELLRISMVAWLLQRNQNFPSPSSQRWKLSCWSITRKEAENSRLQMGQCEPQQWPKNDHLWNEKTSQHGRPQILQTNPGLPRHHWTPFHPKPIRKQLKKAPEQLPNRHPESLQTTLGAKETIILINM